MLLPTALPGADWLPAALQVVLKATLVLAAAGVSALLLRRASAATRHLAWTLSVAALLALPPLAAAVPAWRVPLLPAAPAALRMPTMGWAPPASPANASPAVASTAPAELAAPIESGAGWTWVAWLAAAWGAGALFVLLRLAVGLLAVRRMGRRAVPVTGEEWLFLYDELSYELRMKRPVRLLMGAGATMPMTFGVLRPAILLPADAEGWDDERRRVVLLHELAHVQRLDTLTQTLAQLCCALYWFHPGAWWASARMRAERERACDDRVLGAGARASAYASHLIEVARRFGSMRLAGAAAVAMARPSQLEGRVLAVLDEKAERRGLSRRRVALAAAAVLAIILPLAALHPVGRALAAEARPGAWDAKDKREKATEDAARATAPHADLDDAEAPKDTVNPRVTAALAGALADENVEVRRAAVASLAQHESPDALQALLGALRDPDAEVRRHAAIALGQIDDRDAVPALLAATRDSDAETRRAALIALSEIGDPRAAPAFRAALGDASSEVRSFAAIGLAELKDGVSVMPLAEALKDADAEVRRAAAHALGEIGDARAAVPLRQALREGTPEVRRAVIAALAELHDPGSLAEVTAALGDADAEVRGMAAWALAELGTHEAPRALLDMAAGDRDAEARKKALWALAETRDPHGVPIFRAALKDASAEVRKTALYGLMELHDSASAEEITRLLRSDPDPEVRRAAAAALGEIQ